MPSADWVPAADADFDNFAANFNTLVSATPTAFGLTAPQATAFDVLFDAWHAAYLAAINPATRTSVTIAAKDVARVNCEEDLRDLAAIVQADPDTTDAQRVSLGLTVRDTSGSPIPAPSTKPVVNVERILNLAHVIRIRDEATPLSNAKPAGSVGAEVYAYVGDTPPLTLAGFTYKGMATRVPHTVEFDGTAAGETAWYKVVWINARGERGPVSDDISATVAA